MPEAIVSAVYGPRIEVLDGDREIPCLLRGRLKHEAVSLAVGDRVEYRMVDDRQGVVERVLPRQSELRRSARDRSRRRGAASPEQVVLANADQVVCVVAARDPGISFALLDASLALARACRLPAAICINKMDLAPSDEIRRLMAPYEQLGVPVVYSSAMYADGRDDLRALLAGRVSLLWGGSGVGKSTLIRSLTGRDVKVGVWRTDNPRGPHTTNVTHLYPLPGGGMIADTPGFDWLPLDTVAEASDPEVLLLPEARPLAAFCRFAGCTHRGEPDCAVMDAVLRGELDPGRYARFRQAIEGERPSANGNVGAQIVVSENDLLFRMEEERAVVWTTFSSYFLFQEGRPETSGLLRAMGLPDDLEAPLWTVFQQRHYGARLQIQAKVTATDVIAERLQPGQRLLLRERGVVKGLAEIESVRVFPTTWRLRKAMRDTAIYEARPFWTDLKPPRGVALPPVQAALVTISRVLPFTFLPELGFGTMTHGESGLTLDYLEVGSSEDELVRE